MDDYRRIRRRFAWEIPARFNFGADVVDRFAREPGRLALLACAEDGAVRRFTFADIARLSNRFANVLSAHGIGRGERVLVMLPRIPEWQVAMVGCLKAGAVPVPAIEMLTAGDVAFRLAHSGARAAVARAAHCEKFAAAGAALTLRLSVGQAAGWLSYEEALARASDAFAPAETTAEEPAVLYYTSGSTGPPKGVTLAQCGLYCWRVSARFWLDLAPGDLLWCSADTGWSKAGTSVLFGPWSLGVPVLFYDGPFEPERRLKLIARHGVTVFCGAATELRRLVTLAAPGRGVLRLAVSAGEAVEPALVAAWGERIGTPLREGYGQTETLMTVANNRWLPLKPGSTGVALPGSTVAVLNEEGRALAPGEAGQLALRLPNPQLMLGYRDEPALTQKAILEREAERWFLTGDLARMDEEGYVFHLGRADDVINSGGYRIGPGEVEQALLLHPAVRECAAVASPDAERGEVVKAFVVLSPGHAPSEALARALQDHAKRVTAPYKYPRRIAFVDALPKTPTGKVRRRLLREREFGPRATGARSP